MQSLLLILLSFWVQVVVGKEKCYGTVCENPDYKYPTEKIKLLLRKHMKKNIAMNAVVVEPKRRSIIRLRTGLKSESYNLCKTTKVTIAPVIAESNLTIVNIEGYEQKLVFEICKRKSKSCPILELGYKTKCKQLYNKVRLLSFNETKQQLERTYQIVPSTCVFVKELEIKSKSV